MYKQFLNMTFLLLFAMCSCHQEEISPLTEPYNDQPTIVHFNLNMAKEIVDFPVTKSIPDQTIGEPTAIVENDEKEIQEFFSTLEYIVYEEKEGTSTLLKHKKMVYDPAQLAMDFGIVYDTLPKGKYHCYFLGHNSTTSTLSQEQTFSFDEVSDSFFKTYDIDIAASEKENLIEAVTIYLDRIVGRIEFVATDPVHNKLKQLDMQITNRSTILDLKTGYGVPADETETFTHIFTDEELNKTDISYGFYTFIAPPEHIIKTTLTALDKEDQILLQRNIKNIKPLQNKIIRYSGRLYSKTEASESFEICIFNNGVWDIENIELPAE